MDEVKAKRRLTKKPPSSNSSASNPAQTLDRQVSQSIKSQRSSGSLQRAPSAPTFPRNFSHSGHTRTTTSLNPAAYSSSNSSLDRQIAGPSPVLSGADAGGTFGRGQAGAQRRSNPSSRPLSQKTSVELIGAPFDGSGILNHIDSTKASGYQNSLRRPPPPPLSHTCPDPRMMSPPLRQATSFSALDRATEKTPSRIGENHILSPNRYSDEAKEPKSGVLRKKSGFSGFMNSLVGSPRRVNISAPENPVHVTHVGYDNQTGQFTVGLERRSSGQSFEY